MNVELRTKRVVNGATTAPSTTPFPALTHAVNDAQNEAHVATDDFFADSLAALAGSLGNADVAALRTAQLNARGLHG